MVDGSSDVLPSLNQTLSPFKEPEVYTPTGGAMMAGFPQMQYPSNDLATSGAGLSTLMGGASRSSMGVTPYGDGQRARDPEQRLAMAMRDSSEAPFRPLVYQPATWKGREESRMNSPDRAAFTHGESLVGTSMWRAGQPSGRSQSDPVNTGLISFETCRTLYEFYVQHCHVFLPILDVGQPDSFGVIRQTPALISCLVAIAARFHHGYTRRLSANDIPAATLERSLPSSLAKLAEEHLADILLHKVHSLSDVQSTLMLAAWGLREGGGGPDAWVLSGHAARLGMRLGLHRLQTKTSMIKNASDEDEGQKAARMDSIMRRWRTWLCWSWFDDFVSLGFGRPETEHRGTVDDQMFFSNRLSQTDSSRTKLQGDMLIVSQIRLAHICREAGRRIGPLTSPAPTGGSATEDPTVSTARAAQLTGILAELNANLDDWHKSWIWAGAPCAALLGASSTIVRLQAEHVRLCVNAHSLDAARIGIVSLPDCLNKAANAAISIIQIHSDSNQTGLALSFAPDYVTLCLPQAALFLIKTHKAPPALQAMVDLDKVVVAHYLTMAAKTLAASDLSSTGLSTHLSNTLQAIAKVAGISVSSKPDICPQNTDRSVNPFDLETLLQPTNSTGHIPGGHIAEGRQDMHNTQDELEALLGLSWGDRQENTHIPAGQAVDFGWLLGDMWNQ